MNWIDITEKKPELNRLVLTRSKGGGYDVRIRKKRNGKELWQSSSLNRDGSNIAYWCYIVAPE